MLRQSFIHIPGVGPKTEKYIWDRGIYSWDDFVKNPTRLNLSEGKIGRIKDYLNLSQK